MTNMTVKGFMEPRLLVVCDPKGEHEALVEAAKNGVPVIGLCDTDNETKFIDIVVPINNKGKRALALIFYILSREVMMAQGKIKSYDEFQYDLNFFEQMGEEKKEVPQAAKEAEAESTEAAAQSQEAKPDAPPAPAEEKKEA
jgi:ribosomal protein uS2